AEPACYSTPEEAGLRVERLPFERVPHQTRLFLDYLRDPTSLRRFYPSAVRYHHELSARAPEVLAAHETDRGALCDALEETNRAWGAGDETLNNISRLRSENCAAVVSGQQVGLFTGPLYTIYKALSAVKLAGCLTQRGTDAVPVFWMATEDHDWDEVRTAEFIACDGRLASTSVPGSMHEDGEPVGLAVIDSSIDESIKRLLDVLPATEFSGDLERLVRDSYAPGRAYGEAFARLLTALAGRHGLVLLDPLDPRLKRLAAPLYAEAARRAPEIAAAVEARSRELVEAGYHAQVHASAESFPLFLHAGGRRRVALTRGRDGRYHAKGAKDAGQPNDGYTAEELSEWAAREPESFSPNVTLRAVVQDFLLPTVAYYGGAAEIAYFAQTAEVYRVLSRPATPILHRASLTLIERRTGRALERYDLKLSDFFDGPDAVIARVVARHLGAEQARAFDRAEQQIDSALSELGERLRAFDPTLADALTHGSEKIGHQLSGLRSRFHRAQMARDRAANRQLERAAALLYPEKALQERHLNVTSLLARHGLYCLDWIFSAIDIGSTDHQIVYL
ncbi:MAG: bacillithiol biosynthesis cysteine-adding enzyme BshC, partial [Acidobacteriota bacterium]|nr:bacillithiol biosynthesis cysteine-adding enzyme BshC [Acidobacteriota bacterium]